MNIFLFFFFFKQKTAYEMLRSLVGSEMCIRDSDDAVVAVDVLKAIHINEDDSGFRAVLLAGPN